MTRAMRTRRNIVAAGCIVATLAGGCSKAARNFVEDPKADAGAMGKSDTTNAGGAGRGRRARDNGARRGWFWVDGAVMARRPPTDEPTKLYDPTRGQRAKGATKKGFESGESGEVAIPGTLKT
jgi:hypothetical protein